MTRLKFFASLLEMSYVGLALWWHCLLNITVSDHRTVCDNRTLHDGVLGSCSSISSLW